MIVISDIVLISEFQGEELEYLRFLQVDTVPPLSILSREGVLFSSVPVSIVKLLLKQSTEICSYNSLMPVNLS